MPVYQLADDFVFPHPELAEKDGLLAVGGDLSPGRLITAYGNGIFPWYSKGQPILWWSPDPRMVLFPGDFRRHKNLRKTVNSGKFEIRFDQNFEEVITHCSLVERKEKAGTWITKEMKKAYLQLHYAGICHSVETYFEDQLVGGLYGLSMGGVFFGESMFHLQTDASKVALWALVDLLLEWEFDFIDVQQETNHLRSLGAKPVKRKIFLNLLGIAVEKPSKIGNWEVLRTGKIV